MKFEETFKKRVEEYANAMAKDLTLVIDFEDISLDKASVDIYFKNICGQRVANLTFPVIVAGAGDKIQVGGIHIDDITIDQLTE